MRFVVVGSIVFAVLAVLAAQLGWFDAGPAVAAASSNLAPAPVTQADRSPAAGAEAAEDPATTEEPPGEDAPGVGGPLEVTVTRGTDSSEAVAAALRGEGAEAPSEEEPERAPEETPEVPMPGVTVRVDCDTAKFTAKTGPDGIAHFASVPSEQCALVVREPGMAAEVREVEGGMDTEVAVTLLPEARLMLKVRDGSGRAVPGARVHFASVDGANAGPLFKEIAGGLLAPPSPPAPPTAEEEAEGSGEPGPGEFAGGEYPDGEQGAVLVVPASGDLSLSGLSAMTWMLTVSADGYTSANTEVGLASGSARQLKVVLDREAALSVRVAGLDDLDRVAVSFAPGDSDGPGQLSSLSLESDGAFHSGAVPPGVGRLVVVVDGDLVHSEDLSVAPGAEVQRTVRLNLADIEVEVALPTGAARSPCLGAGGCRDPRPAVTLACPDELYRTAVAPAGVARFPLMPVGTRCEAVLLNRPLGPRAVVTAPGRVALDATLRALRFALVGQESPAGGLARAMGGPQVIFTLTDAADPARTLRMSGMGDVQAEGVAPGRYLLRGWAGPLALAATVEVTSAAEQFVALRPTEATCFHAQVIDAQTGDPVPADFVGYESTATGLTPSALEARVGQQGGGVCYPAAGITRLVVSAPGYRAQAFAPRADLGTVRLQSIGEQSPILSESLRMRDDGAMLVATATAYGLRAGDRLLAIDGERVDGLSLEEVQSRLSSDPSHHLRLKVKSVDGEHEVEAEPDAF